LRVAGTLRFEDCLIRSAHAEWQFLSFAEGSPAAQSLRPWAADPEVFHPPRQQAGLGSCSRHLGFAALSRVDAGASGGEERVLVPAGASWPGLLGVV